MWVHLEESERRERLVNLETLDHLERPASGEERGRWGRRERPDPQELLDPLEDEDQAETTAPKETQAQLDSLETLVLPVSLVLGVWTVCLETRETMEKLDNLVLLVRPERLEYRDLLANGATLANLDLRADKERREPRERLEQRGLWGKPDQWDLRDLLEKPEPRV